jgi:hypothetical protein
VYFHFGNKKGNKSSAPNFQVYFAKLSIENSDFCKKMFTSVEKNELTENLKRQLTACVKTREDINIRIL